MSRQALMLKLETELDEPPTATPAPTTTGELRDMVSFSDLEALLVRACLTPESRFDVSHYVRWMSKLAAGWTDEEALLELLAVLAIAAAPPKGEVPMG